MQLLTPCNLMLLPPLKLDPFPDQLSPTSIYWTWQQYGNKLPHWLAQFSSAILAAAKRTNSICPLGWGSIYTLVESDLWPYVVSSPEVPLSWGISLAKGLVYHQKALSFLFLHQGVHVTTVTRGGAALTPNSSFEFKSFNSSKGSVFIRMGAPDKQRSWEWSLGKMIRTMML